MHESGDSCRVKRPAAQHRSQDGCSGGAVTAGTQRLVNALATIAFCASAMIVIMVLPDDSGDILQ